MPDLNIYHIKTSLLAENITFDNFRTHGKLIQNPDYIFINDALGIPQSIDETSCFSSEKTIESDKPIKDYRDFCKGHWIDKLFHNQIRVLLKEYDLENRTDSICLILLIQKYKKKLLSLPLPKQSKSEIGAIYDFLQQMGSTRNPTIKLMKSGGREVMQLTENQTRRLRTILIGWYFDSPERRTDLEYAMQYDESEAKFYSEIGKKNKSNIHRILLTRLIQNLFLLFSRNVPSVMERHLLIGKLLCATDLFECNLSEILSKKEERDYFHNRLKSATKGLR